MAKKGGFRQKGIHTLAWVDLGIAIAGGSAISLMWAGAGIAWILTLFPLWVPIVVLVLGVLAAGLDCLDGVPNRLAIWCGLLLPSVALAVPTKLGVQVTNGCSQIMSVITDNTSQWTGQIPMTAIAIMFTGIALLMARRVVAKGGGGK